MAGRYENQPRNNSRKRRPKWQRMLRKYWPPIRFGLICLLLLLLIIGFISLLVNLFRTADKTTDIPDVPETGNTTTVDTTVAEPTLSVAERQAKKNYSLNKAAEMAAGYDYLGAIELLQAYEFYDETPEMQQLVEEYQQLDSQ